MSVETYEHHAICVRVCFRNFDRPVLSYICGRDLHLHQYMSKNINKTGTFKPTKPITKSAISKDLTLIDIHQEQNMYFFSWLLYFQEYIWNPFEEAVIS